MVPLVESGRRDVFNLALDIVGSGVAASAATASVNRIDVRSQDIANSFISRKFQDIANSF
jgi:hypothetical protein